MLEIDASTSDTGVVELDIHGYGKGAALQIDGNDLVHLTDISPDDGTARLTVFASSHEKAPILWAGTVNLTAHLENPAPTGPAAG
jgi:hypothetical protein